MALATVTHYAGYGDRYLVRAAGFKPGDVDAVGHVTEALAERIGTLRGGDGNGYQDTDGYVLLDIYELDNDRGIWGVDARLLADGDCETFEEWIVTPFSITDHRETLERVRAGLDSYRVLDLDSRWSVRKRSTDFGVRYFGDPAVRTLLDY